MAEGTDCVCCGKESFWKTTVFTSENDGNFMGLGGITAQATAGAP